MITQALRQMQDVASPRARAARLALVLGWLLAPGVAPAQIGPAPGLERPGYRDPGEPQGYEQYGHPMPASLRELAGGRFIKEAVRTRGRLSFADATSGYLKLTDKNEQVLVIPVNELQTEARSFVGLRVEVVGLPRVLHQSQGTCQFLGQTVPQSICEDPRLPALPDLAGHPFWPGTSLTIWNITDITPLEGHRRDDDTGLPTLRELIEGADTPARERVTVRGRFCGRNLCGGLPPPAPSGDAWVLERDGAAIWVTGKSAKGSGWRLDPASAGDTSRWVEVVGRVQTRRGTRCLQADSVALVRAPEPREE